MERSAGKGQGDRAASEIAVATSEEELYQKALKLFEAGRYAEARRLFAEVLGLGGAKTKTAREFLAEIRRLEEETFQRGVSSEASGDLQLARQVFSEVLDFDGDRRVEALERLKRIEPRSSHRMRGAQPSEHEVASANEDVAEEDEEDGGGGHVAANGGGRARRRSGTRGGADDVPAPSPAPPAPAPSARAGVRTARGGTRGARNRAGAPDAAAAAAQLADSFVEIRRTPHMDILPDTPVKPGATLAVAVYVDMGRARTGEDVEELNLRVPAELTQLEVQVWLVGTDHFDIEEGELKNLVIETTGSRSGDVQFQVRVKERLADYSDASLTAHFSYHGRTCGKVSRPVPIVAAAMAATARRSKRVSRAPAESSSGSSPPPALNIDVQAMQPDLTVEVADPQRDQRDMRCKVTTPHLAKYKKGVTEAWSLPSKAAVLVGEYMADFVDEDKSDAQRFDSLSGAGVELFEAAPAIFRKVFWELIDGRKPLRSIYIVSEEPSIPWELMIPTRRLPTGIEERRETPIGVEFLIGRWTPIDYLSPRQRIRLEDACVIAPRYTGTNFLELSQKEANYVRRKFKGFLITPAEYENIDTSLSKKGAALLHFICHGSAAAEEGQQTIALEGTNATLDSTQIRSMPGFKKACGTNKPLVFLNACEVGRPAPALAGVRGFAYSFIRLGVSAVVAPLWSVKDTIAHKVAVEFYDKLLEYPSRPFAEILRDIRAKAYTSAKGEDTYAAYSFYGDPLASAA